jgi:hypothetical protein
MQLDATTWGIILAIAGIIVSVYFGIKTSNAHRQKQKTGKGGIHIQSGRDTNIK